MSAAGPYRALICVTTCQRLPYLRRYLPHLARQCMEDRRFDLLVSLDGTERDVLQFCHEWGVPLIYSERREGVGLAKNRVLERFPDFDYYFFLEDDVELIDGAVFPAHVELAQLSGIHHFSLFVRGGARNPIGESVIAGYRITHCLFGGADFNFFTGRGLKRVGGWDPRFAEYQRWGHTEHSYRFPRAGLAPAPFNVAEGLDGSCIWHFHPSVTRVLDVALDKDQIAAPERAIMDEELSYVPVQTVAPYHFNDVQFGQLGRLARTVAAGDRYPLVEGVDRRHALSDYHVWRLQSPGPLVPRATSFAIAAAAWPSNPALKHTVKTWLRR